MNLIDEKLQQLKNNSKLGLMTHVVVGYPSLEETRKAVLMMDETGVDFIELQIPFSDPLADGPTIMKACEESLKNGTKVKDAFDLAKDLTSKVKTPLLFMCYYNTVFKYGVEKFCRDSQEAGISGLIVPDIPLDEEGEEHFISSCQKYNLHHIRVLSPASTFERINQNSQIANGFVYFTARQGITGTRQNLDPDLKEKIAAVKKQLTVPIAVGFGISKREHLESLKGLADIAVIGSSLLESPDKKAFLSSLI